MHRILPRLALVAGPLLSVSIAPSASSMQCPGYGGGGGTGNAPPVRVFPGPSAPPPAAVTPTPAPASPGAGPSTPGDVTPAVPATPRPTLPTTPGRPLGPRTGGAPPVTPSPAPIGPGAGSGPAAPTPLSFAPVTPEAPRELFGVDENDWTRWWGYYRERYLDIDAVAAHPETRGPDGGASAGQLPGRRDGVTHERVYARIVPALVATLEGERDPALVRATLLALGRMGEDPHEREGAIAPTLAAYLGDKNQLLVEAAVVSLGVLGGHDATRSLAALVRDDARGRELAGGHVNVRLRSLAAYGLGLTGGRDGSELARFAVHHLGATLAEPDTARSHDLLAACVLGLGLVRLDGAEGERGGAHDATARRLLELYRAKRAEDTLRTHTPTALARLWPMLSAEVRAEAARELLGALARRTKADPPVRRAAVLALAEIGDADEDDLDEKIREALTRSALDDRDAVVRSFSVVALAQVAGRPGTGGEPLAAADETARFLVRALARGKSQQRPWTGLALGVLGSELARSGRLLPKHAADALLHETRGSRAPQEVSAYALACGLIGDPRAHEHVAERIDKLHDPRYRGELILSLGLTGDRRALPELCRVMDRSHWRPELLVQAAIARGLLDDRELVPDLLHRLDDCHCWASTYGAARSLAWVGDGRALEPLLAIVVDGERPEVDRMVCTQALGWIADRSRRSWQQDLSRGVNYTRAPATLTDPTGFGILDVR